MSPRTCLVVQWLGLHALNTAGLGSIPGWRTRSHKLQGMVKKKKTQKTVIVRVKNFWIFLPKRRNEKEIGNLASQTAALRQIAASLDNELAPLETQGRGPQRTGCSKNFFFIQIMWWNLFLWLQKKKARVYIFSSDIHLPTEFLIMHLDLFF